MIIVCILSIKKKRNMHTFWGFCLTAVKYYHTICATGHLNKDGFAGRACGPPLLRRCLEKEKAAGP